MLASLSNSRSANYYPTLSTTSVTIFTLDTWQSHNTLSTGSTNWNPERIVRNYDRLWACVASFNVLYPTSPVLPHNWTENCGRSTDALWEAHRRRITRPTNTAPKTNHATRIGSSKIHIYKHSGHQSSDHQVGYFLLQPQRNEPDKPIDYWSRSFNCAERAYEITHKKCLAVFWAVLLLRQYLEGTRFKIQTDHYALWPISNPADASGKLLRRCLRLSKFKSDGIHRSGIKH